MVLTMSVLVASLGHFHDLNSAALQRRAGVVETRGWTADPDGRGTLSIIISCVLTMILCVWSALHLNIPPLRETRSKALVRNARWTILGVFGPELLLYAAWRQYNSAKTLIAEVNRIRSSEETDKSPTEEIYKSASRSFRISESKWSMIHGHYASMGGFVFDLSNKYVSDTFLPEYDYLTVTPRGVAMLASLGLLPEISAEEIYDKSKSDGLAKAIVILQALWMFIQCIARPAQGLYITLLEINTVAHILCAFIVFIFWWSKPRNVTQPTKVGGEWSQGLVAYMYMSSKMSGHQSVHPWRRLRQMTRPELDWLALAPSGTLSSCKSELGDSSKQRTIFGDRQVASEANDQDAIEADSNPMQETKEPKALEVEISGKRYHIVDRTLDASHQRRGNTDMEMATTISQDVSRMERWISAAKALRSFSQLSKRHLQDSESQPRNKYRAFKTPAGIERDYTWLKFTTEQLCVPVMGNWPTSNLCSGLSGTIMGSVLWFSSMGYGAIHAAGWNDYFPTTTEKWLWRASAVYLAFSGLIWLQINALGSLFPKFNAFWDKIMAARAGLLVNLLIGILCTICGLAYGFARIYLVVESFISLRQLPISAFETPEWTALIPHL